MKVLQGFGIREKDDKKMINTGDFLIRRLLTNYVFESESHCNKEFMKWENSKRKTFKGFQHFVGENLGSRNNNTSNAI